MLTALYVPGDRPERFAKAAASGADAVILDLEDGVLPEKKAAARTAAVEWLSRPHEVPILVRINAAGTPWQGDDLTALAGVSRPSGGTGVAGGTGPAGGTGLAGVRVPKVESASDLDVVAGRLGASVPLHPVVETAVGMEALREITRHPAVGSVGLGEADLASDLGLRGETAFGWVRLRLVVACRAAGLGAPMLSVYADVSDLAGLSASCRDGRDQGFVGRSVVHPRQVAAVVEGFRPRAAEMAQAHEVLQALADAARAGRAVAITTAGQMIDTAMAGAARRTLDLENACTRFDTRAAVAADPAGPR